MSESKDKAYIAIKRVTAEELSKEKRYGETWDDVIRRLLKRWRKREQQ